MNFTKIADEIYSQITNEDLQAISIIYNKEYYNNLKQKVQEIQSKYQNIFIVGMGGSFLGAKTIIQGLNLTNRNVNFIYHIQENILNEKISNITSNDLIIAISKSGNTTETLYILNKIIAKGHKNIITITENKEGELCKISTKNNFEILKHERVSGRFSFLTNVGILPALIAGLDLENFIEGVKTAIDNILIQKDVTFYNNLNNQLFNKNLNLNIIMPYVFEFKTLTKWFCQLYTESLNRKEFNIMPFPSIGTVDQHSLLEGYLQNPEDKMITLIAKKEDTLLYKEYLLTKTICEERGLYIRNFEFKEITSHTIGFLMAYSAIEVIFIAKIIGINPFNQEMVERRKALNI
jgi:glucose-6-phosphate isomerase